MAQVGFGIEFVDLGRLDQRVEDSDALPSAVGSGEETVTAANGHAAQRRSAAELSISMRP